MSRHLPITVAAFLFAASAAFAQSGLAPVIQTLEAQGFAVVETTREANRLRIEARSSSHLRELVYDSRTGELLSDELTPLRDQDRDQDRLQDGDQDGVPDQDQDQDRDRDMEHADDKDQSRDGK
jgi:hypothetical protein